MNISHEALQKYQKAGRIAAEIRKKTKEFVKETVPIVEICRKVEALTIEKGGKPAFPCNVSVNEVAAHYTSPPQDERVIPKNSMVKIDIGVHVDGYIADTAITHCFNSEYENLVQTAKIALKRAIEILRPGLSISRFGTIIEKTIKNHGLKPISNLTGHLIGRYLVHAGKSLPNISHISLSKIKIGEVYAAEPFITKIDAVGRVKNESEAFIFRFMKQKSLRNPYSKELLQHIIKNFRTLPFTERWLEGCIPKNQYKKAFSELLSSKSITSYPVFVEISGKPVAQAEHTVLITKDGCLVLT